MSLTKLRVSSVASKELFRPTFCRDKAEQETTEEKNTDTKDTDTKDTDTKDTISGAS